jgi:hypothetical protein
MDNSYNENTGYIAGQQIPEEPELSHSDKIIGVFSEPKTTFEKVSNFPPKTIDWLLPVVILLFIAAVTNIIMMSNPEIKMALQEKQLEQMQKNFDEAVEKGQMTREQADEQMNKIQDGMKSVGMGITIIFSTVSIFIVGFILFFLMSGIYYLIIRFAFKDPGTYTSVLVAGGLTGDISVFQLILAAVLATMFGRMLQDVSLAAILDSDRMSYTGWVLAKIDPIAIWAYSVLSIALAKMFKSNSYLKYFLLVFGIWLIGGFILFAIIKSIPFLRMFTGA